ncbi:MAG: hypothetical protein AAB533_04265 [Patescibacteria group bacterium]
MPLADEAQKARGLLASAEQVAILLPRHPALDASVAAEALARVLSAKGAYVGFLPHVAADASPVPEALTHVRNPRPLIRERVIAIDTARAPVGQLRYEKHETEIEIILSPKSAAIREDAISVREGRALCDCLIAIAIPDIEAVAVEDWGLTPQFFTETPIITIGNAEGQAAYGEANLLSPGLASLSELAAACITALDGAAPDPETATLLLAGVMDESRNFAPPVRVGTHLAAADLLQAGADQARAAALAGAGKPFPLLQLIARASVRSKETDEGRILWSFLTAEDFEKTGRSPQDAPEVMAALPRFFPPHETAVLVWQDPAGRDIHAMIRARHPVLEALAAREEGTMRNPTLLLNASFLNFPEAEERVAALLREVR